VPLLTDDRHVDRDLRSVPVVFEPSGSIPLSLGPQGFLPKALLLGVGQTIGYMVFSEALVFYGSALAEKRQ
jgi:hypothetical protein